MVIRRRFVNAFLAVGERLARDYWGELVISLYSQATKMGYQVAVQMEVLDERYHKCPTYVPFSRVFERKFWSCLGWESSQLCFLSKSKTNRI